MQGMKRIKQCTITLTRNCNLRCDFCFKKDGGYSADNLMEYPSLKRVVDFCCEAQVKYIFLTGGEPLLYPHLTDILLYIKTRKPSISTAVATNGTLLSDFIFCKNLIESGLEYIDISLKGKDSEEWYAVTGCDGLAKQLQAIRNLSTLPVEFTCSMVITPDNVQTFCETIEKAHNMGAKQFSFTFVIDNNNASEKDLKYLEKHNPFALIESFFSQINKLNNITTEWWIEYSFPLCVYTEEQLSQLKGKLATPCQIHMNNAVTFDTTMELLPCDMYLNQSLGRFGTDFSTFEEFKSMSKNAYYKHFLEAIQKLPSDKCVSCQHLMSCYGGCPVLWKNYSFETLQWFKEKYLMMSSH